MPSQSQIQKVGIEKDKLVELTKLAEKARLYEGENVNLIVENYNLKEKLKSSVEREQIANDRAEKLKTERNRYRFILFGVALAIVGSLALWLIKPKWL